MLIDFFFTLKKGGVPCTIREFLNLLDGLNQHVIYGSVDDFYHLSRVCLVKNEAHFDRFDRAFAEYFKGVEKLDDMFGRDIPEEWLRKLAEKILSDEEKKMIEALGGFDKLIDRKSVV